MAERTNVLPEHKLIIASILISISAWVMDAALDSLVFNKDSFLDALIFELTPHEVYFRTFVMVVIILFGFVTAGALARRRFAEEELRNALVRIEDEKAKTDAIIAAIPDGISIQGRDYRVLYQNDVHTALVGEQLGNICYEKYAGGTDICPGCPVARSFEDGGNHLLEKTLPDGNGGTRIIEITSSPLRNAAGEIIAGIEAVRDITAHKQAEESLKLFSEAIREAMDGVQIVGLDGRVIYSNRAVEEIYGFRADELLGKHVNEMNVDREFASTAILPSIRDQGRWSGEVLVLHKDGHTFPVWLSTSMVKGKSNEPIAMVGIIRDMTRRKQIENELMKHREKLEELVAERTAELKSANVRLQREVAERERMESELSRVLKLESLGLLAGGIAHDFNNLLGSIMGNLSMALLDVDAAHPAHRQLVKAEQASLRAQDLTRQLLTFSRGGTPIRKLIALPGIIGEAAGLSLRNSRVLHELSVPKDLWPVYADEGQLMQVLNNLLINADQAMPAGGIIRISAGNIVLGPDSGLPLDAGRYVKISVTDEGVGIPAEHIAKVFDPFFTTKQKGSGLGLAVSYSIIRKHDGLMTVESREGRGATFHIYLPASEGEVAVSSRDETFTKGAGHVLVMDDEEEMRNTTAAMLERLGYTVDHAADGAEAVAMYRTAREAGRLFDAVIVDLAVPGGMGGKETAGKLLEIDPDAKVIVSSGYSHDPVLSEFRAYGFRGMITKPYRLRDLSEVMASVIGGGGD